MSKKILFLTPRENLNVKGGISTWTSKIIKYGLPYNYNYKIVDTSISYNRGIFYKKLNLILEFSRTLSILSKLIAQLFKYKPTLVHFNCSISPYGLFRDIIAVYIIKLFSIPVVVHYRGNLPQPWKKTKKIASYFLKIIIKKSDLNLAMNETSLLFLNSIKSGSNNFILESFIDDSVFTLTKNNLNNSNSLKIIFVGAIAVSKGGIELIELAKLLPRHEFILIGKLSPDMECFFQNLPKNISFLGQIKHDEIYNNLQLSDIFIFPSHTEGFPNAVLEAMAIGLPVIGTNVGSIPSMIDQGIGGYLVNIGEIKKMKKYIEFLSSNFEIRRSMGVFNKKKSKEKYSYSVITKKLINLYKNELKFKNNVIH